MGKKIGIDLGTTYSCVANVDETGRVQILDNSEGEQTTPSVVFISGGEVVVGSTARQEGGLQPECIVERVKNYMGDPDYSLNVDGTDYSPAAISRYILEKLVRDAKDKLGEDIDGAVVTCPAYFGDHARAATKLAAEKAGLNVLQILDEPTAAALAYGYSKQEDMNKTILIYDLGGGTFDCTVMKLNFVGDKREMEVITTGGDHLLGGKDWDRALTEYITEEFCNRTGCDAGDMACDAECIQMFSENIEKTKKLLTSKESATMTVSFDGQKERIEITRDKFNELTESLLNQTISLIDNMLSAKNLTMDSIDEIILVGGSTRMPQVKARLDMEYGKPISSFEPDKAVAMGAALMASFANYATSTVSTDGQSATDGDMLSLGGATEFTDPQGRDFVVKIKCTKSYGIIALGGENGEKRILSNIILKDTEKPCAVSKGFLTVCNNQASALIEILENNSLEDVCEEEEGTKMYEDSEIKFPYPVPKGTPMEVTFVMDKDGTLEVELSVNGGPKQKVTPVRLGNDANFVGMDTSLKMLQ